MKNIYRLSMTQIVYNDIFYTQGLDFTVLQIVLKICCTIDGAILKFYA